MEITIPNIPLPFEIPALIHPFFVHFAISLPIIILLIEIINLFAKRKIVGGISFFLLILTSAVLVAAYFTGITDANLAKDSLSGPAKEALADHKQYGIYLVYLSLIVLFFKLISSLINKIQVKILFLILLIGFIGVTIITGKKGGELVYKYGINVGKKATAPQPTTKPATTQPKESPSTPNLPVVVKKEENTTKPEAKKENTTTQAPKVEEKPKEEAQAPEQPKVKEETTQPQEQPQEAKSTETNQEEKRAVKEEKKEENSTLTEQNSSTQTSVAEENSTQETNSTTEETNSTPPTP
ncbi:MAG: DUF2231 domain-containing protein [Epsilonproteobacteria bacterium]|nr:DUF2231 domain-containing protein [Campylobacterota bacterium]